MPVTCKEEKLIWLLLSAGWALGGVLGWLASLLFYPEPVSGVFLFLAALAITAIGIAIRLPILTGATRDDWNSNRSVLLLSYAAGINWLGCLLLHAPSLLEVLPAIFILALGEIWIHCQFYIDDSLAWLLFTTAAAESESVASDVDRIVVHDDGVASLRAAGETLNSTGANESSDTEEDQVSRTSVDGIDAEGRRYLSGEIRLELRPEQPGQEVTIGFCPAFEGEPDVDFELTDERVQVRLLQCTPAGMRLSVRRCAGGSELDQSLCFELHWYAVQSSGEELAARRGERVLP